MAAQSNPPASFGYTWGFADNSRSDGSQIVEISPNINYTVSDNVSFNIYFNRFGNNFGFSLLNSSMLTEFYYIFSIFS